MEFRLNVSLGRPSWWRPSPFVADAMLAVLIGATTALISMTGPFGDSAAGGAVSQPDTAADWIVMFVPSAAVAFRRTTPVAAAIVGSIGQAVVWALAHPDFYLATGVLLYSVAANGRRTGRTVGIVISIALTVFTGLGWLSGEVPLYAVTIVGLFSAAAVALGINSAGRHAYIEAVEAQAREIERSTTADQQRAVTEERNRIARDLHDVVAHGLSVIVVQSAAAQRILDRDPDGARAALGQIETTGRNALAEMRQVLSVLRTEPGEEWRPAPGLAALDELVTDLRQTGLAVTVDRDDDGPPLPATVDMTAYRIIQESLTNVLKHGGPNASAAVAVERAGGELAVRVVDDGRGAAADAGSGHGLRGMRERVEIFGGRFSAGPRPGGGFAVEVALPVEATS